MSTRTSTIILFRAGAAALLAAAFLGCSRHAPVDSERKVFGVSVRRYDPQPVYKRTRLAYLPAPIPVARTYRSTAPLILPVIHFELTDASLEDAARILGETSRYSSYCASSVADKKITLTALGTVDELAKKIAKVADISTIVDHHNREIRFLATEGEAAEALPNPELLKPSPELANPDPALLN